ncbi:MAG: thioredoxin [bacterium]|nr:thioredoxin [bacterium]
MAVIRDLDVNSFDMVIQESQVPVLVDFWADWCGPCKAMEPMLEEISGLMGSKVKFVKVNVDEARRIAIRYHVQSVPTLLVFDKGRPVDTITGVPPRFNLVSRIEKHL